MTPTVPSISPLPNKSTVPSSHPTTGLHVTPDERLLRLLPSRIGHVDLVGHVLKFGDALPRDFSDDLGRALMAINRSPESDLSVAWVEATPEDAARNLGLTMFAIRVQGVEGTKLRQVVVGDRSMIIGPPSRLANDTDTGTFVVVHNSVVGTAGDVVFLISFPAELYSDTPPAPDSAGWTQDELRAALPDVETITRRPGTPGPIPTTGPHVSPRPDLAAEALLPTSFRGVTLKKVSASGAALFSDPIDPLDPNASQFELIPLTVMASIVVGPLDLKDTEVSAAAAYGDGLSSFFMTATRVPGLSSRLLTGAVVDEMALQGWRTLETIDVDGRPLQLTEDLAFVAIDDVLYSMTYFDMGDSFGATFPPRPDLRDLAVDTVRALP
jgi:hypothetical protein